MLAVPDFLLLRHARESRHTQEVRSRLFPADLICNPNLLTILHPVPAADPRRQQ